MDIQIFGITFADFLRAFKKAYKLSDGSYDYMAFFKDADCASYCGLMSTYKNPNAILNMLITPTLNNIQIINGGKKKMKGGGGYQLLLVGLMYVLTVSNVFAGPIHEMHVTKYGNNPDAWPKEPTYPENRFWGLFNPSDKDIETYNKKLSEFREFEQSGRKAIGELQTEVETKLTEAQTKLTEAQTEEIKAEDSFKKTKQIVDMSDLAISQMLINNELQKQNAELKGILKGIIGTAITGFVGIAGLLYFIVNRNPNNNAITNYGNNNMEEMTNGFSRLSISGTSNNREPRREISYGGKKTRKHRKKRTNRRK